MKSKRFVKTQKETFRRECRKALALHLKASVVPLWMAVLLLVNLCGLAHPSAWKEITTTVIDTDTHFSFRFGGSSLRIDTVDGPFTVYAPAGDLKSRLETGKPCTFTYADNLLDNAVTALEIEGTEYVCFEASVNTYHTTVVMLWSAIAVLTAVTVGVNAVCYKRRTKDAFKTMRECRRRLRE